MKRKSLSPKVHICMRARIPMTTHISIRTRGRRYINTQVLSTQYSSSYLPRSAAVAMHMVEMVNHACMHAWNQGQLTTAERQCMAMNRATRV